VLGRKTEKEFRRTTDWELECTASAPHQKFSNVKRILLVPIASKLTYRVLLHDVCVV
jgi:hypothetical protein